MKRFIGCCGIDCESCDAYIATMHNDDALREKTAKLWAELNQAPILPEHINCHGCRSDGVKTVFCDELCAIRNCAMSKGNETCGDCAELTVCQALAAVAANHPEAMQTLRGADDGRPG